MIGYEVEEKHANYINYYRKDMIRFQKDNTNFYMEPTTPHLPMYCTTL